MTHVPSLGPRGVGWVLLQGILLVLVGAAGLRALAGADGLLGAAWSGPGRILTSAVAVGLMGAGAVQAWRGVRDLGSSLTPLPHPRDDARLVETGIYGSVRHPIYGGLILLGVGWALLAASPLALALALMLVPLFWLKSSVEERWLLERFPGYDDYRHRTRRFIAWIG
jgi:protein-S-isoprenylcysteine O-methyltransferase Ste14